MSASPPTLATSWPFHLPLHLAHLLPNTSFSCSTSPLPSLPLDAFCLSWPDQRRGKKLRTTFTGSQVFKVGLGSDWLALFAGLLSMLLLALVPQLERVFE